MSIDLWVFDVGRGLCVAVRSPNNNLAMIDCGASEDFSPVKWLSQFPWAKLKGFKLTQLIISHPHSDHLADIAQVTKVMPPCVILRRNQLNWDKILAGNFDVDVIRHYIKAYMPPNYNEPVPPAEQPDWGDSMTLQSFWLASERAEAISQSDSAYTNNTSIVTVLKYKGYTFVFPGDIESAGMDELLKLSADLRMAVAARTQPSGKWLGGVHFLVAPHHGHPSGFCANWFRVTGPTQIMNIASERRKGSREKEAATQVDTRYSQAECSVGANREKRRMVSTKADGHIHLWLQDDGKWNWEAKK